MMTRLMQILTVLAFGTLLAGCAAYPAVQIAGAAMTGYDAVSLADEHLPRTSVEGGKNVTHNDAMLERRLRERLKINRQDTVTAHVINSRAYLVGRMPNRATADRVVDIASTVQGLTGINCKFFPAPDKRRAKADARTLTTLRARLENMQHFDSIDLHVDVISGNAVLVGRAWTFDQKSDALNTASRTRGVLDVVDYIVVQAPAKTAGN